MPEDIPVQGCTHHTREKSYWYLLFVIVWYFNENNCENKESDLVERTQNGNVIKVKENPCDIVLYR